MLREAARSQDQSPQNYDYIYIYLDCKSVWMRPTAKYVSSGQLGVIGGIV